MHRFLNKVVQGDCLEVMRGIPAGSVDMVMTSPPYWGLRAYKGGEGMIGLEDTFQDWLEKMVAVFSEVRRVLKDEGTCWVNIGDAYAGGGRGPSKGMQLRNKGSLRGKRIRSGEFSDKNLILMPARFALALQADGWFIRSEIIWHKPNPMPEGVSDRPTSSHEKLFLFTKSAKYFYDASATREKSGANLRNVWTIAPRSAAPHFATYPEELCRRPILAGCPKGGIVLDPFFGTATTGVIAIKTGRNWIGIGRVTEASRQQRIF